MYEIVFGESLLTTSPVPDIPETLGHLRVLLERKSHLNSIVQIGFNSLIRVSLRNVPKQVGNV